MMAENFLNLNYWYFITFVYNSQSCRLKVHNDIVENELAGFNKMFKMSVFSKKHCIKVMDRKERKIIIQNAFLHTILSAPKVI